ncbi:hypothetical protein H6F77_06110 [Microcoleus sp. FACHB-831]|uniref:hypothetical protein n=1 Tax=Microcoleus sp. FACHB-831 TaxID=2692827 RepID=UPI001685BA48|nr:hypothetical protein [Microcoleus sp. FACHB-831]MBD1920662.1 hypothetical protein [Microcoleus sp. FACHB-831]
MPKFTDTTSWQQAELLMQPAFIRVIDQIRKQIEQTTYKGTYQDVLIWPEGTPEETKATVLGLRQELEVASPEQADEIREALANLPLPYPGYVLSLQYQGKEVNVDLWELCYQVCFKNYSPAIANLEGYEVEIDTSLIDETGDVDWNRLDAKAKQLVEQVFVNLPAV